MSTTPTSVASSRDNTNNGAMYSWHLSLRADRPVENCPVHPHAYMYGKKLDQAAAALGMVASTESSSGNHNSNRHHHHSTTKTSKDPPPSHEFSYRWFRSTHRHSPCAFSGCPRRTSFSPHDWSSHALQTNRFAGNNGSGANGTASNGNSNNNNNGTSQDTLAAQSQCSLQCVSTQSSLYKCIFCNSHCFRQAWKTQYTVANSSSNSNAAGGNANNNHTTSTTTAISSSNHQYSTPNRSRSHSVGSHDDETASVRSTASNSTGGYMSGTASPVPPPPHFSMTATSNNNNGNTPRGTIPSSEPQSSTSSSSWVQVSQDQIYLPGPDDVGHKLKIEAAAYDKMNGELLMSRVCKTDVVLSRAPPPSSRVMVTTTDSSKSGRSTPNSNSNGTSTATTTTTTTTTTAMASSSNNSASDAAGGGPRFRMATYNVLAEIYATQQQYPYCDFWALSWDYRFGNILAQILDAHADVICLQEIQADHYENHVYASMSDAGYEGVFKQKTRQSMGLAGKVDGCALFWKRTKFHLIESYSIEFNEVAQRQATQVLGLNPRSEEGSTFLNRLSRDNVAQLVVLEYIPSPANRAANRESGHQVCIANTHLYSHKDFPDVKLWQSWQLLQELESFIMNRAGTNYNLPLVLCGDFNSTPDTAVYDLLSRQQVHPAHPDVNTVTDDGSTTSVLPDVMNITHSFQLGSAYNTVMGQEPWVTNYTVSFQGVLDYIWYSAQNLRPLSVAPIPSRAQLTRFGQALPNTEYSSDHVMLIADLQFVINSNTR